MFCPVSVKLSFIVFYRISKSLTDAMSGRFNIRLVIFLCHIAFYTQISNAFVLDKILEENETAPNLIELYIPTVNSRNEICRNHSLYFLQELRNYTLWATEMFDATTKFPTGILQGSVYDFGNFDECLALKVPYQHEEFSGKYCIAKFSVASPYREEQIYKQIYNYKFDDYKIFYNVSMWKKIEDILKDASASPVNRVHFSYCMPSSCTSEDLQQVLENFFSKVNENNAFKVNVEVNKSTCQVSKSVQLDGGDIIFILVIVIFVLVVILASTYDLLRKRDDFAHLRLNGKSHDVILCFSFQSNFRKLTSTKTNPDGLDCLAGMKVYSMFLIILLHRQMFDYGSALINPVEVERYYSQFGMTFMLNGPILVDTFFTISGFLATYLILNQYHRGKNGNMTFFLYFHRYLRMTSTYCIVLAFYCTLFVKLGTGPLWQERIGLEREKCRKVWWANILYINNYVDTKNYCMFQSWYMACDMDGFIFVPIICSILWKKASAGVITIIVAIVSSMLTVFVVVFLNNEQPILLLYLKMLLSPNTDSTFLTVYIPGHMRISSYFVGVAAGYIKYKMKVTDYKVPKRWIRGGWIICVPLMFLTLHIGFAFYVSTLPAWCSALYASLHHFAWSICIAWMIIAISSGHGHWVKPILSWNPLVILSRLTYTVYLCHSTIQLYTSGTIRNPVYASKFMAIHKMAADIILGYLLAFVLTMLFESPIIGLEKVILWQDKKKADTTKNEVVSATEVPSSSYDVS